MDKINSFDIFDTLLARKVKKPTDIFWIVEKKYNIPNFHNNRIHAEQNSNGTFQDIYEKYASFQNISNEEKERLKLIEVETELENIIPIETNIKKIKEGDILISDMYLDEEILQKFIKKIGISQQVKIYVSPSGKHNGHMYQKLLQEYNIQKHTGDNVHSDIHMANQYGIQTTHTTAHQFTKLENEVPLYLANIIREFRLRNPYCEESVEYEIYTEQCRCNILMLSVFACQIKNIVSKENIEKVLFATRDCCLLQKIFCCFFPEIKSQTYHTSRIMNDKCSVEYVNYVKNIYTNKSIIIDLNGSFKSGRNLYTQVFGKLPRVHLLCYNQSAPKYNDLSFSCQSSSMSCSSDYVELLNTDIQGTLVDYREKIFFRSSIENDMNFVKILQSTVEEFLVFLKEKQIISKYIACCEEVLNDTTACTKLFSDYFFTHSYRDILSL